MFLSGHFEETATLHSIAIAHESARARLESSVAFLTSVVVAEGREKGTEQLKEGRKGRAGSGDGLVAVSCTHARRGAEGRGSR